MCVVSSLGDYWKDRLPKDYPWIPNEPPAKWPEPNKFIIQQGVSQEEFDKLKKEVQELKELLKAAQKFDTATGQPDCELDEKIALIKKIAELVGVNMDDVFKKN